MFDTGVFSLCVLPDKDSVHIIVRRLEALDGHARPNVGEEIESATKGKVQRYVTLTN